MYLKLLIIKLLFKFRIISLRLRENLKWTKKASLFCVDFEKFKKCVADFNLILDLIICLKF